MKFTALIVAAVIATMSVAAAETPVLRALAEDTAANTGADEMDMQPDAGAMDDDDDQQERHWGGGRGGKWGYGGKWGRGGKWGYGGKWGRGGGKWGGGKWGRGW
uniref:Uncharacterized protein n=1 Tax=Peronospora matthiolae TaxID=2874970 RepID=A0AAV1TH92_9STRA